MKLKAKKGSTLFVVLIVKVMFLIVIFAIVNTSANKMNRETGLYNKIDKSNYELDKSFTGIHTIIIENCNQVRMNLGNTDQVSLQTEYDDYDSKLLYSTKHDTLYVHTDTNTNMNSMSSKNYNEIKLNIPTSIKNIHAKETNINFYSSLISKSNEEINWYISKDASWDLSYNYEASTSKTGFYHLNKHHIYSDFSNIRITNFDYLIDDFIVGMKNSSKLYINLDYETNKYPFNNLTIKADNTCAFNVNGTILKRAKIEIVD